MLLGGLNRPERYIQVENKRGRLCWRITLPKFKSIDTFTSVRVRLGCQQQGISMHPRQQEALPQPDDGDYDDIAPMPNKRQHPGEGCHWGCSHIVLLGVIPCITLLVETVGGYLAAYYLGPQTNCGKRLEIDR